MNTVYVVTQCWQDYGDGGATPILATPNIELAEAKVDEMKLRQVARKVVYSGIQEHMKHWEVDNPRPQYVLDKKKKTKEQPLPLNAQFAMWAQKRYAEMSRFIATFTQPEQDDYRDLNDDLFWEIETVPYEE